MSIMVSPRTLFVRKPPSLLVALLYLVTILVVQGWHDHDQPRTHSHAATPCCAGDGLHKDRHTTNCWDLDRNRDTCFACQYQNLPHVWVESVGFAPVMPRSPRVVLVSETSVATPRLPFSNRGPPQV